MTAAMQITHCANLSAVTAAALQLPYGQFLLDTSTGMLYSVSRIGTPLLAATPAGASGVRTAQALSSSGGIVTIDLSSTAQVYTLTLTENVTGWVFNNPPVVGRVSEIRVQLTQGAGAAYTCVSPATAAHTAGGVWVVSATLGAEESLGLAVDSSSTVSLFPSGVYA